ncbi:MAG: cytochrome c3 family protein, partial [Vicinamibacterales bacterium]
MLIGLTLLVSQTARAGQLGALLSPGPLARAHRTLEGAKCAQCHEAGRKVSATRCLTCHKPVADRVSAHKGVHRQATECVSCHKEHAGLDGDLRHLDVRAFNHTTDTSFPLDGLHAKVGASCTACHKGRSFLEAKSTCDSCHADVHKGALGASCTKCHSTTVAFKSARAQFDHSTARFQLTGAHQRVACEQCHKGAVYKGVAFASCTSCHKEPHDNRFGPTCTSCHTTERWSTQTIQHAKTAFPLTGAHVKVACAKCHTGRTMTEPLRSDRCAACHVNVHRDSIKEDCATCHSDTTFKDATFDHNKRTAFALEGKHEGLSCVKCHSNVSSGEVPLARRTADYSGAHTECVSCHADKDPHKGAFGRACDSCHKPATFAVKDFRHPREPAFFGGQHQPLDCVKCHLPDQAARPKATTPLIACVSCHADTHLGQLGSSCDQCHTVDGVKFKALAFSHDRARLTLTGKHQ